MRNSNLKTYFKNIGTSLMFFMTADGYRRTIKNDLRNVETERVLNETIRKSAELERKLNEQIEQEISTNTEVQSNLTQMKDCLDSVQSNITKLNEIKPNNDNKDLINESLKNVSDSANNAGQLIDKILDFINNSSGSSSSSNNFTIQNLLENYHQFFDSLTTIQKGAFAHILLCTVILFCIFDILVAYYSDKLITYLNIENKFPIITKYVNKYPILNKYLQLRRKLRDYYIKFNFILIIIVVLIALCENILILSYTL